MKKVSSKLAIISLILIISCPLMAQQDLPQKVIAKGASLEQLNRSFSFTEGPTADKKGNVYFTDQPNDRIMVWTIDDKLETFMQPSGRSNGMFFDKDDNLWVCADENTEIWKITPNKQIVKGPGTFNGAHFNGPNDLWVAPNGNIYFTDPFFQRDWWDYTEIPQEKHCVYLYVPSTGKVVVVADDLTQPNGIVGTPDGKTLYVADNRNNQTWSWSIQPDGSLTNKQLFCNMSSDGITIDSKGNIYITGRGVTIFNKKGKRLGNIPVKENWTSNVCFGGTDRKYLYITASEGLYRIKLKVSGVY